MSAINKELYDALIAAGVSDELAAPAAQSVTDDKGTIAPKLAGLDKRLAVLETRLSMIEKLQWVIVVGVIGLVVKSLLS